jgi:hypothetical protein
MTGPKRRRMALIDRPNNHPSAVITICWNAWSARLAIS